MCELYCLFTATEIGVEWNAITLNYASWYKNPRLNSGKIRIKVNGQSTRRLLKFEDGHIQCASLQISIYHIISITAQTLKERQSIFEGQ